MYIIKADGKLLYSPELIDDGFKLISPRMHLEIGAAGYLEFTMPPCNALYDDVLKMKSIITVEQDGEVVFRGRISEESVDTYKQRRVYCEGDLAFLLDSLQGPCSFTGTQYDLFSQLIASHNAQMEAEKWFMLGDVSGLDTEEVFSFDVPSYMDTMNMIQTYLIDLYGGYIQTRTEGGVTYIDYVDGFTDECSQKIEFGVNLLDFESQINAEELCTVLVPLGTTLEDGTSLTIASVNDGKVYIENPEAIARYGRVYKTYTWENVTDPAELMEMGMEYMSGAGLPETLSITALDMHLVDADVEKIRKGSMVHLLSKPHGIDKKIVCASIDADLENADQTVFVLGLPKQRLKTLAEQVEETAEVFDGVYSYVDGIYSEMEGATEEVKKMSDKVDEHHKWLTETETSLNVYIEAVDLIGHRVNQVALDVDVAKAEIALRAFSDDVDILGQRLTGAEVRINGAEAAISLKAAKSTVDELGERLSTAEVRINGANSSIELLAEEIRLAGYVTADAFKTETLKVVEGATLASMKTGSLNCSGIATVSTLYATGGVIGSLIVNGGTAATQEWVTENFSKASAAYKPTLIERYGSVSGNSIPVQTLNESGEVLLTGTVDAGDVYTNGKNSVTLTSGGWSGGSNTVTASNGKSVRVSLPSFSTSGGDSFSSSNNQTTVYFYTSSVNGYLASKTVDATPVYNNGWNACRDACVVEKCLMNYWSVGEMLYDRDGNPAGSDWYKGTVAYLYHRPAAK